MKTILLFALIGSVILLSWACTSQPAAPNAAVSHAANNSTAANSAGHQGMNHGGMDHAGMASSPNAVSAAYDLQFLDTMSHHHQAAVDMAKPAVTKASHAELQTLAKSIISDQEKETGQMKQWRDQWFPGAAPAVNMEMSGMQNSMKGMDMSKLDSLTGNAFDIEFIKQMTPHHEGAVAMAKEALQKSTKPEIKTLAESIIKSQDAEIKQMGGWQNAWSK